MEDKLKELKETLDKANTQLVEIRKDTSGLSGLHNRLRLLIIDLTVIIKELENEK